MPQEWRGYMGLQQPGHEEMMRDSYQEILSTISEEEKHELIEKMARFISERGLAPAGILLFDSLYPLHNIGSQAMYFLLPFAEIIFDSAKYQRFAIFLQDRENLSALVKRIDELDEELYYERRKEARLKRKRRRNQMKESFRNIFKRNKKSE